MLLVTRPLKESLEIAKKLKESSIDYAFEPVLEILTFPNVLKDIRVQDYEAVIVTSKQALLEETACLKDLSLFVVGKSTAKKALNLNFKNIFEANGDVSSLIQNLKNSPYHKFLYLRGVDVTQDLKTVLTNKTITEKIIYEAKKSKELSSKTVELLKNHRVTAVTFYSKRTASHFCALLKEHMTSLECEALCLSESIKKSLEPGLFKKETILDSSH